MDEFLFEWVVDFGPQPTNNHIDDIGVGVELNAPDMFGDLFAGDDFTTSPSQMSEKKEFLWSQI